VCLARGVLCRSGELAISLQLGYILASVKQARVAQWIAHQTSNLGVLGSSPSSSIFDPIQDLKFF
jgi:hypothetical protein